MLGARSVAGNRFDTFTEKSHSLRWAATRVLYCPWDWRTPSDRRNSAQTPTSAGFRRVSHRSRIVHIAGMAPKWTVRSVCSCTLSLSGARAALLPWSASGAVSRPGSSLCRWTTMPRPSAPDPASAGGGSTSQTAAAGRRAARSRSGGGDGTATARVGTSWTRATDM